MKRLGTVFIVALLLFLTACSATTITQNEGNYTYSRDEDINIIEIDTRNHIGTLTVTGMEILKNNTFTIPEISGSDENGNDIYKDAVYEQLVQIYYQYDSKNSGKTISQLNFSVYDQSGDYGENAPNIEYSPTERTGEQYFVVALKNRSEFIDISFKYDILQTTNTAKIKLNLSEKPNTQHAKGEITSKPVQSEVKTSYATVLILFAVIVILVFAIIILVVVLLVQSRLKK